MEVSLMTSQLLDRPSSDTDTFTLTPDQRLVERYRRLATGGAQQMRHEALRTARYELDLPLEERRRKITQRLRSWLSLSAEESKTLVRAVKDAYRGLELSERLDLIDTEHDAVLKGLTFAEAQRIAGLVPWLGDCAMKTPSSRRMAPAAMSFLAASMTLDVV
jgi:hypothetical protein